MSTLLSPRSSPVTPAAPDVASSSRRVQRVQRFDVATVVLAVSLVASVPLYLIGLRFVVVLACLAAGVCLLPSIAVLRSLVGRVFFSGLLFFAVFQIAATVQFFALPSARFAVTAAITAGIYLIAVVLSDVTTDDVRDRVVGIANRHDAAGAIVAAVFLLPFVPMLIGDDTVARIAQIGGSQAIDATNHFRGIAQMMRDQHWTYYVGHYYPQSFHITAAFLQDSLFVPQTGMGWQGAVLVFMGQYLVLGVLLAFAIGYFLSSVLTAFSAGQSTRSGGFLLYAASCATGVVAGSFLLWPFVQNGFLNYYYALATILVAFAVLLTGSRDRLFPTIALYLVLVFGAGLSWPLLIPPLLATLALVLCQKGHPAALRAMPKHQLLALAVLVALQLVPIAMQLTYSGPDASQGINLTGSLRVFHPLSLALGAVIVLGIAAHKTVGRDLKDRSIALLLPLLAFIGVLALMQLFLVGEVRYYVIKSAFLLETLNVVFLSALVAVALARWDLGGPGKFFTAAVVPAALVFSLFALTGNPLDDVRNLWRTASGQEKPAFFDADLSLYSRLGSAGELDGFNSTVLHHDPATNRYSAHMQIEFWANMMQYDASPDDEQELACNGELYTNLAFGDPTEARQDRLLEQIKECARITKDLGREFIIVTDPGSKSALEQVFGGVARIESDGN